jgi:hypothetical protein
MDELLILMKLHIHHLQIEFIKVMTAGVLDSILTGFIFVSDDRSGSGKLS